MWLKDIIIKTFKTEKEIVTQRYRAASFFFVLSSFLFFLNYLLVWARFYYDFFIQTLSFTYIVLLIWILFYIYYFIRIRLIWKWMSVNVVIFIMLLIFLWLFSLVVVFWDSIKNYINF